MSIPSAAKGMLCVSLVAGLLAVAAAVLLFLPMHRTVSGPAPVAFSVPGWAGVTPPARCRVQAQYAALPLAFEENKGQADAQVKYIARGEGYTLFLTRKDAMFSLRSKPFLREGSQLRGPHGDKSFAGHAVEKNTTAAVTMDLLNANSPARVSASNLLPGKSNYFLSKDPRRWHTGVSHYARVSYENVYPGVDLAFHGYQRQLEFDFVVAPYANPAPIAFHFAGANGIRTDTSGNLVIASGAGDVLLHKPVAYQQRNGARKPIDSSFIVQADNQVSFALGNYDRSRELVIDPSVNYVYSTYLGGVADDAGEAIAIDSSGNAYIAGDTSSTDFPTTTGATYAAAGDVFVTKISADGSNLLYSTFVGGTGLDGANGIAVDAAGDAFVDGSTSSGDFPFTSGAYQTVLKGAANAFVFELNPAGSGFVYSTFLGGTGSDIARAIALDSSGSVYAVGTTTSTDFPTLNPVQSTQAGSFLTKLNSSGSGLVYSTYLGGGIGDSAFAVALDPSNNAYVTGKTISPSFPTTPGAFQTKCGSDGSCNGLADAFVSVINAAGNAYVYSTFLGGGANDYGNGIAVDALGNAYVTGQTSSPDFPLSNPLQGTFGNGPADAFITKLNPTGSALVYSTFLGGGNNDVGASIALDVDNNAYVTGQTNSSDFPVVSPVQSTKSGGYDAFVSEINGAGSQLTFSTFLGGSQDEDNLGNFGAIAVDSPGANIYVTGNTASTDFPTHVPFQASNGGPGLTDAFAVKYAQNTFSLTASPPTAVSAGASATSTVTLTAYNGYNFPVNLSCSVSGGGSPAPACSASSFSPNPQTPTVSPGSTSTLTITTTGPIAGTFHSHRFLYAMWLPITGLFLGGIAASGRRRKRLFGLLMVSMVLFGLVLLPACGSVSGKTRQPTGGTPAGNYTVTITGTGTDANTTTQSTQITLTVN